MRNVLSIRTTPCRRQVSFSKDVMIHGHLQKAEMVRMRLFSDWKASTLGPVWSSHNVKRFVMAFATGFISENYESKVEHLFGPAFGFRTSPSVEYTFNEWPAPLGLAQPSCHGSLPFPTTISCLNFRNLDRSWRKLPPQSGCT